MNGGQRVALAAVGIGLSGFAPAGAADVPSVVGTWRVEQVVAQCTLNGRSCRERDAVTHATWAVRRRVDQQGRQHLVVTLPATPGKVKTVVLHRRGSGWVGVGHAAVLTCTGTRRFWGTGTIAVSMRASGEALGAEVRVSGRASCPGTADPLTLRALIDVRGRRAPT